MYGVSLRRIATTMRTSRVAKDTAKLFDASATATVTSTSTSTSTLPRRSTRSATGSLARFSYNANGNAGSTKPGPDPDTDADADVDFTFGSDIEDAVKPRPTASSRLRGGAVTRIATTTTTKTTTAHKRKRATTTTNTSSSPPSKIKAELLSEEEVEETKTKTKIASKPRRAPRKPARKTTDPSTGVVTISPPSDWEEMYAVAKEMRLPGGAAYGAAVDTMGCERLAAPSASARDRRFHTLVALMLSSQTKDTVNAEAMRRLQTEMPAYEEGKEKGLNLENMLAIDEGLLNEMIWKVGFHNNKTKYLKQAAVILRDKYNGDIPDTIDGLMSLPGVGPKMAHLCMAAENGWNRVEGIGVDVHVHRITNLWGWQNPPSKTPEETRLALQSWLPHDKWKEINWLLVGLGQAICLPVGRKCGDCELGLRGLCRAAEKKKVVEGRKRRETFSVLQVRKMQQEQQQQKKMGLEVGVDEDEDEKGIVIEKKEEDVVMEDEDERRDVLVKREEEEHVTESIKAAPSRSVTDVKRPA